MQYCDLDLKNKRYLNGKIAQYIDAYIRQHKVWTPEQMLECFAIEIDAAIQHGRYNLHYEDGVQVWSSEEAEKWLLTREGKAYAMGKMERKYEKDKPVARANSPIVERVRFGCSWDKTKYFDVPYGLKDGYNFVDTEELKKYPYTAWGINHVEQKLDELYHITLPEALELLCISPIETAFAEYWLKNYYCDRENPGLIPEVCGFRAKFYYYEYNGSVYASYKEASTIGGIADVKSTNFRFDFFVSNTKKAKAALIELDGHEYHKTKPQRIIDSIKRNTAANLGIPVIVFTGTQINANISNCFDSISDILTS